MDAALHRHRDRSAVSARLFRAFVPAAPDAGVTPPAALAGIQAILLDIEGTTTPIAFVFEVLFPYARCHLRDHLAAHAASPEYGALLDRLRKEHDADERAGESVPPWPDTPLAAPLESAARYCDWLMDRDRKSTPLKELQGRIWADGYGRGELIGRVFPDVPQAFARWSEAGIQLGIFSSGSVRAQQLLFRHSTAGDLTPFLRWYFDTTTGPKTAADSYRRIGTAMGFAPGAVLFVSDVTRELAAARHAGLNTRLAKRPGNQPQPDDRAYTPISDFNFDR
jgi:enolase-phosphatase E1